jgi:hypothetical protein
MNASALLFLLLVLACPLMMIFMMRGHSHDSGQAGGWTGNHAQGSDLHASTDDLRRQRDELDRQIAEQEAEERETEPVGGHHVPR